MNPDLLVVRYGVATHGFLVSRDRGRSFRAVCSEAVAPELKGVDRLNRLSYRPITASAAVAMDGRGRITFGLYGAMWSDDGSGCKWSGVPEFQGKWPHGIRTDPRDPNLTWALVSSTTGERESTQTRLELYQRNSEGTWSAVGAVKPLATGQVVTTGDLVVFADATRRRLYVSVNIVSYALTTQSYVLVSDDDGKTWREHALPTAQEDLLVLAVDPSNPDRVLAAISTDQADALLLSENQGASFGAYAELRAVNDVTFDAEGRVFVADAGDSTMTAGGLYRAERLGQPLTRVGDAEYVDCVHHDRRTDTYYMCSRDRFGVVDPDTGVLTDLVRIDAVPDLLECPDRDLYADCASQLNDGPAWCCAGHYPFTPFCGEYNVTLTADGRRVFCGLAGREYDRPADAGAEDAGASDGSVSPPQQESDASMAVVDASTGNDASADEGVTRRKRDGGCSVSHGPSKVPLVSLLGAVAVWRAWRSSRRCRRREGEPA